MTIQRSKMESNARQVLFAVAIAFLLAAAALSLPSCSALQPPERYVPGENFGDGGATRCGSVNTPRQWLRPC